MSQMTKPDLRRRRIESEYDENCGCEVLASYIDDAGDHMLADEVDKALGALQAEIERLRAENLHIQANHDNQVKKAKLLIDRIDLPVERVKAYEFVEKIQRESELVNASNAELLITLKQCHLELHWCNKQLQAEGKHGKTVDDALETARAIITKMESSK